MSNVDTVQEIYAAFGRGDVPAILEHLRGGGPHFQGCWVLEFLSGRNHSLVSHGGISADNSTG